MDSATLQHHFRFFGHLVKDKVTNFEGVATSLGFDLYGCIQYIVAPQADKDGKIGEARWFDSNRLEFVKKNSKPVMDLPNFAIKLADRDQRGGADKPLMG